MRLIKDVIIRKSAPDRGRGLARHSWQNTLSRVKIPCRVYDGRDALHIPYAAAYLTSFMPAIIFREVSRRGG